VSAATLALLMASLWAIWRTLDRRGFITAQPHKCPHCAWKRFTAEQPNQPWQADVTS